MNYYLILEKSYTYDDGREENTNIDNFLLETTEELKSANPDWRNVVYSYDEQNNWTWEYGFTKISLVAFEEMKKYLKTRKEL